MKIFILRRNIWLRLLLTRETSLSRSSAITDWCLLRALLPELADDSLSLISWNISFVDDPTLGRNLADLENLLNSRPEKVSEFASHLLLLQLSSSTRLTFGSAILLTENPASNARITVCCSTLTLWWRSQGVLPSRFFSYVFAPYCNSSLTLLRLKNEVETARCKGVFPRESCTVGSAPCKSNKCVITGFCSTMDKNSGGRW